MSVTAEQGIELRWMGTSGGCDGLTLNAQPVQAGTRVCVAMRLRDSIQGQIPDSVFLFERYERRIADVIRKITGRSHKPLDELILKEEEKYPGYPRVTDDWAVKPPVEIKGRLEVFASLDSEGRHRGPHLTSVAFREQNYSAESGHATKGAVDIQGLGPKFELSGEGKGKIEFSAVAALDPDLEAELLLPGDHYFDSYLDAYLQAVADRAGLDAFDVTEEFHRTNEHLLIDYAGKIIEWTMEPDSFHLDAGQSQRIRLTCRSNAAHIPVMAAVRVRDVESGLQTVSDLFVIGDDSRNEYRFSANEEDGAVSFSSPSRRLTRNS